MKSYYFKKPLLLLCYKWLSNNENSLNCSDLIKAMETVGFLVGLENRADIVCILLNDIIELKDKGDTSIEENYFSLRRSKSDLESIFKYANWTRLLDDQRRCSLGFKIERILDKNKIKSSKRSNKKYFINEYDFLKVIELTSNYIHESDIRKLIFDKVSKVYQETDISKFEYPPIFERLVNIFELTDIQKKILFFYYLFEIVGDDNPLMDFNYSRDRKVFNFFSKLFDVSQIVINREFRNNSKLLKAMLIEKVRFGSFNLADHIFEILEENDENCNMFSFFFEKPEIDDSLDIKDYLISKDEFDSIKYLVKCNAGSNLLLYGRSGTGKTEFTRSIGKKLGLDVYKIKICEKDKNSPMMIKSALIAAKSILNNSSLLVVDEAEEILNTDYSFFSDNSSNKAWVNTYMEEHELNIIWITNDVRMHHSTKRRFDLSICFESFTRGQRTLALTNIQHKSGVNIFDKIELTKLAKDYTLDPGALNLPFKKMGSLSDNKVNKKNIILTLLDSHMKFINGKSIKEKPIESFYNPEFINISVNEKEIMTIIKNYYQYKNLIHNLCILFQGVPGTGKTEHAKYISEELGKNMQIKRTSDILSPFLGITERNIAEMFKAVEKEGDILFLDECDSLFRPRESAKYSWIVSQTNELLTQMERFRGVLICATNFVENLDRATLRRFHLKVKFKDLRVESLVNVYKTFFSNLVDKDLSDFEKANLECIKNLNPGDFKAVYSSIVLKKNVSNEEIISRLKDEVSYKQKSNKIRLE